MSEPHTKPTDGNPPAPILRAFQRPIGAGLALERPEQYVDRPELKIAPPYPVKHGNFDKANEARRSVHAGATSHDCEAA